MSGSNLKFKDRFLDFCSLSREEKKRLYTGTPKDRYEACMPIKDLKKEDVVRIEPMSLWEQFVCILFLGFGPPNGAITIPITVAVIGYCSGNVLRAFVGLGISYVPLTVLCQAFVPSTLHSWLVHLIVRYFSCRIAYDSLPVSQQKKDNPHRPQILVAPPHGVFPYGNILAMMFWPTISGHHFLGLAANSAVRVFPYLRSIGVVDASRPTARKALENYPHTIGISTGGVAEVFETNDDDECVILKERIGLIKLAIRTGADLVPCYVFGNTKLLSCWMPGGRLLENLSRKVGFAMIGIYGRFGLPVPYRIATFCVTGTPIPTASIQCEEPTMEQITKIQGQLLTGMESLFDKYKGYYGWDDKRLIIK